MAITITNQVGRPLVLGVVEVHGIALSEASSVLKQRCAALAAAVVAAGRTSDGGSGYISESQRKAVRGMLRQAGFSPTGRNRPAHELLLNLVLESGAFPHISNAVDVNNLLSMQSLLPISLFDAAKVGAELVVRWGLEGESFVFNKSGHELPLKHCLVSCNATGAPLGSPIKDSMAAKVFDGCTNVLAVIYGVAEGQTGPNMIELVQDFVDALLGEAGGECLQQRVY